MCIASVISTVFKSMLFASALLFHKGSQFVLLLFLYFLYYKNNWSIKEIFCHSKWFTCGITVICFRLLPNRAVVATGHGERFGRMNRQGPQLALTVTLHDEEGLGAIVHHHLKNLTILRAHQDMIPSPAHATHWQACTDPPHKHLVMKRIVEVNRHDPETY